MKGEIIAIGTELVCGRVKDTNTFFLSRELARHGLEIRSVSIIPDEESTIAETLLEASGRSAFVVVTGGLGPTRDDLTVKAVSRAFKLPLKQDPVSWSLLKAYAEKHHLAMGENVKKMALLPEGATKLDTQTPKAGFLLEFNHRIFYFLPGIPAETKELFERVVLRDLLNRVTERPLVLTKIIKIFGLREVEIENRISDLLPEFRYLSVSFLPCFPEQHLHVTVKGARKQELKRELDEFVSRVSDRLGDYIYGYDDETMESVVGELLKKGNYTLSVAESCTGGLIGHRITNVSGSSDYFRCGTVVYSNEAKVEVLGIDEELIRKHGAVSEEVATAMCSNVKKLGKSDLAIATTGIAGPTGGTPEKPVGTIFIGIGLRDRIKVKRYLFEGNRHEIKTMTSQMALDMIRRGLLKEKKK